MKYAFAACGIILLIALVLGAGCTDTTSTTPTATPVSTPTQAATETAAPTEVPTAEAMTVSMTPGPTDTLASTRSVDVSIEKAGTYSTTIITSFDGGKGLMAAKKVVTTVYTPEGAINNCTIGGDSVHIGDTCEAQGSKGTDRVVVQVYMNDGKAYTLIDQLVPYKTHG
ncbi:MAG: hypothetical protein ABFC24_05220 [Methanoregulaceae archaeon]